MFVYMCVKYYIYDFESSAFIYRLCYRLQTLTGNLGHGILNMGKY